MSWRLAKSLETLRSQINAAYPGRDKSSDGTIGDAAHANRDSDHNENEYGVVTAMDITHDPARGLNAGVFADMLRRSKDRRIKYLISNARIASSITSPWAWRAYGGSNPHRAHFHISVMGDPSLADDSRPWVLSDVPKSTVPLAGASDVVPEQGPSTAKDPKFHSLVPGGYFSSTPYDDRVNTSIRTNNPGALNVAPWVRLYPGFIGAKVTSMSGASPNATVIFETPEHGVAAWWELMRQYREEPSRRPNAKTVKEIITKYGGTGQDYSKYVAFVKDKTGLRADSEVRLVSDDANLLKFAKAMFHYEAGKATPLSDAQIIHGFNLARTRTVLTNLPTKPTPPPPPYVPPKSPVPAQVSKSWWKSLWDAFLGRKP